MKIIGICAVFMALVFTSCGGGDNMSASSSYPRDNYSYQNPGDFNYNQNYNQNYGYPGYYPPTGRFYTSPNKNNGSAKGEEGHEMNEQGEHHHGG